ncbi:hypothetical protein MLD38_038968 [Melastoma candidum]|uniref:Uncharacterized protein n=1 Tax=Melastoma candidum TaxID=119954 RepID=A0ACB9L1T6_9MYRT|nr:hypothetical protein MLD38_038968 [Melastoma candidum]
MSDQTLFCPSSSSPFGLPREPLLSRSPGENHSPSLDTLQEPGLLGGTQSLPSLDLLEEPTSSMPAVEGSPGGNPIPSFDFIQEPTSPMLVDDVYPEENPGPSFDLFQEPSSSLVAEGKPSSLDRHGENTRFRDASVPSLLFPEHQPSGVGAGLHNLGFTCFLNAVLQCLTHTVPLTDGLLNSFHTKNICDREKEGFCVLCSLRDHVELSLAFSGRVVSPHLLVNNINYISSDFLRYQQEDAHELQHALLDKLERCCIPSKTADENVPPESNLVDQVFGGRLISKLICCNCGHCSCTYEPLVDLSLEIGDVDTISAALDSFTHVEKIEDADAKFSCSSCNEEVSMEKQLLLDKAPSVAALHLKRFKNDGYLVEKIDKHVEFPLELDLQPYISCSSKDLDLKYQLYAIVVHVGRSPTSGHYFSFVRSSPETWFRFDDSEVCRVQEEFVLSQGAYILYYAREGIPWFSSLMEKIKPELPQISLNVSPKSVLEDIETAFPSSPDVDVIESPKCREFIHTTVEVPRSAYLEDINCNYNSLSEVRHLPGWTSRSSCQLGHDEVGTVAKLDSFLDSARRNFPGTATATDNDTTKPANDDIFGSLTPSRSPSPASPYIYIRKRQGGSKDNGRPNPPQCKRQLNKMLEDPERKEAIKFASKSMHSSRGSRLVSALLGSIKASDVQKSGLVNRGM